MTFHYFTFQHAIFRYIHLHNFSTYSAKYNYICCSTLHCIRIYKHYIRALHYIHSIHTRITFIHFITSHCIGIHDVHTLYNGALHYGTRQCSTFIYCLHTLHSYMHYIRAVHTCIANVRYTTFIMMLTHTLLKHIK